MSNPQAHDKTRKTAPADAALPEPDRRVELLRPAQIFDPVARALDVIGDRWSLVLIRHLLTGARGFQELRQRTGIAPRVLSSRLRQLRENDFVEWQQNGQRQIYRVSAKGRRLEPIIASIARWWVHDGIGELEIDASRFNETSPQSVIESMPFLLREDKAAGVQVVFEIRLTGEGGGVWTVEIDDGQCWVHPDFAEGADVRYTATARDWCAAALGLMDAKEALKRGRLHKEGGAFAIDEFFHLIARPLANDRSTAPAENPTQASSPGSAQDSTTNLSTKGADE